MVTGVDIDGEGRKMGSNVDMGADEYKDEDSDGLPDWFERELDPNGLAMNPNDDLDGDDYTNIEEYIRFSGSALIPSSSTYVDPVNGDDLNLGHDPNQPKKTLQGVFEVAGPGERIILKPGLYKGSLTPLTQNLLIQSIDPKDADIVASTLIASPLQITGQSSNVEFNGLTFATETAGAAQVSEQAFVNCTNANAMFTHCRFVEHNMMPLMAYNATLTLRHCEFSRNSGLVGAAFAQDSDLLMENCLITHNFDNGYSQALTLVSSSPDTQTTLINCTIANNDSDAVSILAGQLDIDYVPAILQDGGSLVVTNSILWDSNPLIFQLLDDGYTSHTWITYSNLSDTADTTHPNWFGLGNISLNPGFVALGSQPGNTSEAYVPGDYHLLSEAGRWDMLQDAWVQDTTTSQSIGAANPAWPAHDPNGAGTRLNLGAYGNTAQASQAPDNWSLVGDLTHDGIVNALDETAFTQHQSNSLTSAAYLGALPGDLDQDGDMDAEDLQILQSQLGQTTPWYVEGALNDQWSLPPLHFGSQTPSNAGGSTGGR